MADETAGERILTGGWEQDGLVERGGVVFRRAGAQSPAVLDLLRHLEAERFPGSPRVAGTGFSPDGHETLTFIEGDVHDQPPWSDDALRDLGRLLRGLHDATRGLAVEPARWRPTFLRALPAEDLVLGHGDLGPWNIVSVDGRPVGFIDWDAAGPVGAEWEVPYVAWLNVELHDDDVAERRGLADVAGRGERLRIFLDAYGLPRDARTGFIERIAEVAIHEARDEAVRGRVTPETTSGLLDNGFPVLWAVAWRARSASWILSHREVLTAAIL